MSWLHSLRDRYQVSADPLRTERRIELVVIILGLLFVLELVYSALLLSVPAVLEAVLPAKDSLQVRSALNVEMVTEVQSEEVLSRPLFWTNRRPVDGVESSDSDMEQMQDEKLEGLELVGVFTSGDSAGIIALVEDEELRVTRGETVKGWRLESVSANEVVFTSQARKKRIVLYAKDPAVTRKDDRSSKQPRERQRQRRR